MRGLVEQVYAREDLDDVPEPLRNKSQEAIGNEHAASSIARGNLLKLDKGYAGEPHIWSSDMITPTRIGPPTIAFRLGKIEHGVVVPYYANGALLRAWALSEASFDWRKADGIAKGDRARDGLIKAAKEQWPEWERDAIPLLVLEPEGTGWRGGVSKQGEGEKDVLLWLRGRR